MSLRLRNQRDARSKFETGSIVARDELDKARRAVDSIKLSIRGADLRIDRDAIIDNPYTERVKELRNRRDTLKSEIANAIENNEEKQTHADRLHPWIKGFKDIKLLIVEEVLQELEITTNGMLDEFGLTGWQIRYDVERETKAGTIARGLNVSIISPYNTEPVKFEVWSGGETQRLLIISTEALASVLLNHVGVTTNLEWYDEPTYSMSAGGVQDLVDHLAYRAKTQNKNIWLIDHQVTDSSQFAGTVTVERDDKGSKIMLA
jgi:hypothetical protein